MKESVACQMKTKRPSAVKAMLMDSLAHSYSGPSKICALNTYPPTANSKRSSAEAEASISGLSSLKSSGVEFVAHAFHSPNECVSDLFSQFPDVHIDGPTANDHFVAPDLLQDLFAAEHLSWFGTQQT